jgi:hypothetical protein
VARWWKESILDEFHIQRIEFGETPHRSGIQWSCSGDERC